MNRSKALALFGENLYFTRGTPLKYLFGLNRQTQITTRGCAEGNSGKEGHRRGAPA
jgi:hypothetical protein